MLSFAFAVRAAERNGILARRDGPFGVVEELVLEEHDGVVVADGPAWDVLQEGTSSSDALVVSAFQSDTGVPTFNVKPTGLQPGTTYQVQSVDTGLLGTATGAALMSGGIDLLQSPTSAAHILIITARQPQ